MGGFKGGLQEKGSEDHGKQKWKEPEENVVSSVSPQPDPMGALEHGLQHHEAGQPFRLRNQSVIGPWHPLLQEAAPIWRGRVSREGTAVSSQQPALPAASRCTGQVKGIWVGPQQCLHQCKPL